MLLGSLLAFFLVIFLVATLTAAIAWLAFLKRQTEAREAARNAEDPLRESAGDGEIGSVPGRPLKHVDILGPFPFPF